MKKYFSLVAGATMMLGTAVGITLPANAQTTPAAGAASGPFADVPADHWAYQAVNTLQRAGIVIGYPDGTYGGRRAMTRYEFAVAIARLLPMIQQPIDTSQFVKNSDFQAFQNDVNGRLQQQQQALDALRALVNEFQPELERLGQDVDAIKRRLDADEERLAVVEDEQRRLKITGDVNFIARANVNALSGGKADPLDENGYRSGTVGDKSLLNDVNVYHDILLNFDGRVSDTAHAIVSIDAGNYLPFLGSYESLDPFRDENTTPATDTFSIFRAYLDTPVSLGPLSGAEFVVGRFGTQFTKFTLKAIDPDVYTNLPETDTGDVTMDGAKLNFGISGAAHVQLYAAKNAPIDLANLDGGPEPTAASGFHRPGSVVQGGAEYFNTIDQSAGARITFGTPDTLTVGFSGLIARVTQNELTGNPAIDPYARGVGYNNLSVYSADINGVLPFFKKSGITLDGEFADTPTGFNNKLGNVNGTHGNEAYYAELGYTFGKFNVKGGYEEIYNNFAAPGFWGQIGTYYNPSNVRGGIVSASLGITNRLRLVADGNILRGIYNIGDQNPLGKEDHLNSYDVGLKYGLSSAYGVDLGYQYVQYDLHNDQGLLANAGHPTERYYTIGIGHSISQNASLKFLYQILDYQDEGTLFDPASGGNNEYGGVAVTQFSLHF